MYSVKFSSGNESKRAKGVTKFTVQRELNHKTYDEILKSTKQMFSLISGIRSQKHRLYTVSMNKISLSAYDDKRYICKDGINSLAYGHKDINTWF